MGSLFRQASFHTGELAPEFYGRTDQPAYAAGLRLARNFIPTPRGALDSRPGSKYVAEVKDSTAAAHRLVGFIFSDAQTYVIEFGNLYVRFYSSGGRVLSRPHFPSTAVGQPVAARIMLHCGARRCIAPSSPSPLIHSRRSPCVRALRP